MFDHHKKGLQSQKLRSGICGSATAQRKANRVCSIQMYHKTSTTNIPCSNPIKKTTRVTDQGSRANNSSSFLLVWDRIQKNEIINLLKKSMNRGLFIVKNASIPLFPDTLDKEKREISEVRANRNTSEPMFQKGKDNAMLDSG